MPSIRQAGLLTPAWPLMILNVLQKSVCNGNGSILSSSMGTEQLYTHTSCQADMKVREGRKAHGAGAPGRRTHVAPANRHAALGAGLGATEVYYVCPALPIIASYHALHLSMAWAVQSVPAPAVHMRKAGA